mgnify:CR=1 FL=1
MSILVYALHYEGEFNKNSLGAVSEGAKLAKELGVDAHAVVVGDDATDDLCKQLGNYGASKVYRAPAPAGLGGPVVDVMAKLIEDNGYDYVIFGGGLLGFEIGAGLAARLHGGVTMEVTEVKAQDGKLVAVRPILQDSAVVDVGYSQDGPAVIIGRLNAFEIAESGSGDAEVEEIGLHLGSHQDETGVLCEWHVNEAHYLETWGDVRGHDGARIDVSDTGVGIDAAELPHIFERFYRGSRANEARGSGSGLGLAIVRSIVDMHGGTVEVETGPDRGSRFTVHLPGDPRVIAGTPAAVRADVASAAEGSERIAAASAPDLAGPGGVGGSRSQAEPPGDDAANVTETSPSDASGLNPASAP